MHVNEGVAETLKTQILHSFCAFGHVSFECIYMLVRRGPFHLNEILKFSAMWLYLYPARTHVSFFQTGPPSLKYL